MLESNRKQTDGSIYRDPDYSINLQIGMSPTYNTWRSQLGYSFGFNGPFNLPNSIDLSQFNKTGYGNLNFGVDLSSWENTKQLAQTDAIQQLTTSGISALEELGKSLFQKQQQDQKNQINGLIPKRNNISSDKAQFQNLNSSLGTWGDFAVQAGQALGQGIGGNIGNAITSAASNATSVVNSIKNLKNGVRGVGMAGSIGALTGAAFDIGKAFLNPKTEYSGDKGSITETMDSVYDGISTAAMNFGPIGAIVGGSMKALGFLGQGLNNLGIGTNGMTTQDAILGSSLFNWNVGLVNSIGAKKTQTITKDTDIFANVGSSYTGTNNMVDEAVTKSGKRYGNLSRGAYNKANRLITESDRQQEVLKYISDEATDRFNIARSTSAINNNKRAIDMLGGYQQANVRVGKKGMKISYQVYGSVPSYNILASVPFIQLSGTIPSYKVGGILPTYILSGTQPSSKYDYFVSTLPDNLKPKEGDHYDMRTLWELGDRPQDFDTVKGKLFHWNGEDNSWHANSVIYDKENDEYIILKSPEHPSYNLELQWYFSDEGKDFREKYRYDPILNKYINDHKKTLLKYKNGGSVNVIPEGQYHSRKHNMGLDGVTKKGIPVIDNNGEQTAEIERQEIILRLEVTTKLEKLNNKYAEATSKKDKEDIALEAGLLLVHEILNNTIDNTNLINNAT